MNQKNTENIVPNVNYKEKEERNVPDLRFKEYSGDYTSYTFNDIALYKKGPFGSALKKEIFVPYSSQAIKVYEQQNAILKDHTISRYYISLDYFKKMKSFYVKPGDIIVSCAGTIGEIYTLPKDAKIGVINQALMRINPNYNIILHDYFVYSFEKMIKDFSCKYSNGSAIKNIPPFSDLKKQNLKLPNLNEQQKVIYFLDSINKRIDTQKKIIESKKSLIKSISQYYFKNKISNIELKDVVLINKGKQINGSLLNDTFNYLFFNGGSEASGKYNDYNAENCISISEGGNSCGYVNFVKEKFWSGGHNYTLIPTKKINLDYLYFFLKYKEKEIMSLRVGTGLPNIQKESLYKFKIYVPNYNIQNGIALTLMKFSESIENEEKILKLYKKQKDYLLNKMFI